MKSAWLKRCGRGAKFCGACCVSLVCWTFWLGLSLLLCLQLYVAFTHELPVPTFIVHQLESRLAASGVKASFGRTSFDPTGRVLVENTQLSLDSFEEPVATAKLLYLQLDPWSLLAGDFNPHKFHASGVNLFVPAMLSSTGRRESALRDVDLAATLSDHEITLTQLTAHLANLAIDAGGSIDLRSLPRVKPNAIPLAELLVGEYAKLSRRFEQLVPWLAQLDTPMIHLNFRPSENLGAIAQISLHAEGLKSNEHLPFSTGAFEAATQLPLWSNRPVFARITANIARIDLPHDIHAEDLRAILQARFTRDTLDLSLRHTDLDIRNLQAMGVTVSDLSAQIDSRDSPEITTQLVAQVGTQPLAVFGTADIRQRSGVFQTTGKLDPELMTVLGQQLGHNIRQFLNFGQAPQIDLNLEFAPGAKFTRLSGQVFGRDVYAYHVTFDEIGGHVTFDGKDFVATDAAARIGANFARGSYEMDATNLKFRFLLKGQLDPPDIGGWFHEWWPNFWQNFDFSAVAPRAEVDVQGRWLHEHETSVFVYADADSPKLKDGTLDHVTTRIFVRPGHYDAMDIVARLGDGRATGSYFRRNLDTDNLMDFMTFDFQSTLPLPVIGEVTNEDVQAAIAPFTFTQNPTFHIKGKITGPDSPEGAHRQIEVQGYTDHPFTFHEFPLESTSFSTVIVDDNIDIQPLRMGFAHGKAFGKIEIQGKPNHQRLGFDLNLKDAKLRDATVILDNYAAVKRGDPPPKTSEYINQTALVALNLDLSAIGDLDNPYSFTGEGNATLNGPGLGEVRLLGLLSELLNFTALSFTNLRTNFTIAQDHLQFTEVSLTGPNAAISAHGSYALDPRTLDFNARIYPFKESKFFLKSMVGAFLTPLSNVLEVKLTGDLAQPSWAFVIGPTNFFRNLLSPSDETLSPEINPPLAPVKTE